VKSEAYELQPCAYSWSLNNFPRTSYTLKSGHLWHKDTVTCAKGVLISQVPLSTDLLIMSAFFFFSTRAKAGNYYFRLRACVRPSVCPFPVCFLPIAAKPTNRFFFFYLFLLHVVWKCFSYTADTVDWNEQLWMYYAIEWHIFTRDLFVMQFWLFCTLHWCNLFSFCVLFVCLCAIHVFNVCYVPSILFLVSTCHKFNVNFCCMCVDVG
jgi:hypothetical protein